MCALQNLHFATVLVGNTAFANVPTSKLTTSIDYIFEILLVLRDLENNGEIRKFCRDVFSCFKNIGKSESAAIEKFLSVVKTIWTGKDVPRSHIIIAESMVPFLMEMSKYYGYDESVDESLVENDGDHYIINTVTPVIRYDKNGELFRKVDGTPVDSGSVDSRCLTPDIAEEVSKLLSSPHPSQFVPIDLDEGVLEVLLGGGVSAGPRSPSPATYSEAAGSGTSAKPVSPMESIPEEAAPVSPAPASAAVETEKPPEGPPSVIGTLFITHKNGRDIAFINHLKNEKGEKLTRTVNDKVIEMNSIFLSRFSNFKHLKGEKRYRVRALTEFLDVNRYVETQYFPKAGFMDNMEIEVSGDWINIFRTREILSRQ